MSIDLWALVFVGSGDGSQTARGIAGRPLPREWRAAITA